MKNKKLVIFGTGETADIAFEYFTHDSNYEVVAFTVEAAYKNEDNLYSFVYLLDSSDLLMQEVARNASQRRLR